LGKTVEGRTIPLLRLSDDAAVSETEPEVLLITGVHPREQAPQVCLIQLVDELLAGYDKDPRLTRLVKERQIWLVPMLNVDGKIHDMAKGKGKEQVADWRKNRRPNTEGVFGIDLNRNFAVRWGGNRAYDDAWRTDTTNPQGNIYEGPSPLSEPETQALAAFIAGRKNLRAFMDLHSPLRVLLFPTHTVQEEHDRFQRIAKGMQARQKQPYPISSNVRANEEPSSGARSGDTGLTYTWAYYTRGVYGFNFELGAAENARGVAGRYPPPETIHEEYKTNFREPMLFFLDSISDLKPAQTGNATCKGEPKIEGKVAPGETITLTPADVEGRCDWAVLVSETRDAVVQSEYRRYPFRSGFTLQIDAKTKSGTRIPLTLYLWDKERRVSTVRFTITLP
jgi:carboxypeptidase T